MERVVGPLKLEERFVRRKPHHRPKTTMLPLLLFTFLKVNVAYNNSSIHCHAMHNDKSIIVYEHTMHNNTIFHFKDS